MKEVSYQMLFFSISYRMKEMNWETILETWKTKRKLKLNWRDLHLPFYDQGKIICFEFYIPNGFINLNFFLIFQSLRSFKKKSNAY